MKKETRFWKKGIKVLLALGLLGSMLVPTSAMANEYVTPSNAKADADTYDVTVIFNSPNDRGVSESIQVTEKKNVKKGSTYKELGVQFPTTRFYDIKHGYGKLDFLGWVDDNGNVIDENTVLNDEYINLYAKFEKLIVPVSYQNLTTNNSIASWQNATILLDHGSVFSDLIKEADKFIPSDINKEAKFSGWGVLNDINLDMDRKLTLHESRVEFASEFENKTVVSVGYQYYDTTGRYVSSRGKWQLIDNTTTYKEILEDRNKFPFPESFKDLRITGWGLKNGDTGADTSDTDVVKNLSSVVLYPNYENYIVRFLIDDGSFNGADTRLRGAGTITDANYSTVYAFVAEKGDVITVPEIKEFTNIEWAEWGLKPEGENLIVKGHTSFYGIGDKVDAPVVNPDDEDNNGTDVPDVTLPEEEINNAVDEVKNAAKGEKVTVDMKDNVTLPVEVLESARGKDVEVVFNMGAYSWSINGLDITADTLKAINLEVKLDANAISADVVKTLAGDRPTMQLSLSHNGEFGFKAKLQFNLGAEHKGKYGNLYYYNKDGKLEFMNAGKIDENGNVSLEFTHASDYVVVIDEKSMAEDAKKTENPIQNTASTVGGNGLVGMLVLVALGGTFYLANKKAKTQAK